MDEGLLIALVEQRPNLYDKQRKDFKDQRTRENSWQEISNVMGESEDECQRVWRNLRDRFVQERKTMKEIPSGSATTDEPRWDLYKSLMFLTSHILTRRTSSNLRKSTSAASSVSLSSTKLASLYDSICTIISPEPAEDTDISQTQVPEIQQPSDVENSTNDDIRAMPSSSKTSESSRYSGTSTPASSRRLKRKKELLDEKIGVVMEGMIDHLKLVKKTNSDACFTRYVESRLEELFPGQKRLAKKQILLLLDRIEEST